MPELDPWIIRPSKRPWARIRLFCFPGAGGGPPSFRGWPEECDPLVEVALIQCPGRGNRIWEAPLTSMTDLAQRLAGAVGTLLDKRYAFYGHSLGAKVAFETARELRRRGAPEPVHFFAAASPGPGIPWDHPLLHRLGELDLLRKVQERYDGVPNEVIADAELRALVVPALRADITIVENYRFSPEPPLRCPITCFGGTGDFMTPESEIADWRKQTCSAFRVEMFPGGHFFPVKEQSSILRSIAADLRLAPLSQAVAQTV